MQSQEPKVIWSDIFDITRCCAILKDAFLEQQEQKDLKYSHYITETLKIGSIYSANFIIIETHK